MFYADLSIKTLEKEVVELHAAEIEENGFSVMEGAIPEDFLVEIQREIIRLENLRPGGDIPLHHLPDLSLAAGLIC